MHFFFFENLSSPHIPLFRQIKYHNRPKRAAPKQFSLFTPRPGCNHLC